MIQLLIWLIIPFSGEQLTDSCAIHQKNNEMNMKATLKFTFFPKLILEAMSVFDIEYIVHIEYIV